MPSGSTMSFSVPLCTSPEAVSLRLLTYTPLFILIPRPPILVPSAHAARFSS
jgi:hypothetical protein